MIKFGNQSRRNSEQMCSNYSSTLLTDFQLPFEEIYSNRRQTRRLASRWMEDRADFGIANKEEFEQQVIVERHNCEPSLSLTLRRFGISSTRLAYYSSVVTKRTLYIICRHQKHGAFKCFFDELFSFVVSGLRK